MPSIPSPFGSMAALRLADKEKQADALPLLSESVNIESKANEVPQTIRPSDSQTVEALDHQSVSLSESEAVNPSDSESVRGLARQIVSPSFFVSLDATHTNSEAKIYGYMYRQTISRKIGTRHFTVPEFQAMTGIRSVNTIRKAIKGLIDKCSIEVVGAENVHRFGYEYKVIPVKEIFRLRAERGIVIHEKTRDILTVRPSDRQSVYQADRTSGSDSLDGHFLTVSSILNKQELNTSSETSSLGSADDALLIQVQELFQTLSNGGKWKPERDNEAFQQIKHVPLWHIIMGLCYSVTKSTEHKFNSLVYAVPSILDHYEKMKSFPSGDMLSIAYKQMRVTVNCIENGKWTIPEWGM